jgi:hypothetical protein
MQYVGLIFLLLSFVCTAAAKDEFQVNEFVNQQLNSIGSAQARDSVKTRVAQGDVTYQVLNLSPQVWQGQATLVSEGNKLATLMKFPPTVFITEWFVRDGSRTSIAPVSPGRWTKFGNFVKAHDEILSDGLWAGTLSTGWALAHLDEHPAKLVDQGIKQIDGVNLRRIDYIPKKMSDLDIQLYFEPETFRHVMTVYLLTISARTAPTVNQARNEHESHYRVEERFGEFKSFDNVMLPTSWRVRFTHGTVSGGVMDQFQVNQKKISQNISLDPKNFEIK